MIKQKKGKNMTTKKEKRKALDVTALDLLSKAELVNLINSTFSKGELKIAKLSATQKKHLEQLNQAELVELLELEKHKTKTWKDEAVKNTQRFLKLEKQIEEKRAEDAAVKMAGDISVLGDRIFGKEVSPKDKELELELRKVALAESLVNLSHQLIKKEEIKHAWM